MASTFMGLEIARRGLSTHQLALQTTGHNISNADNENYSRQRVNMSASHPLYDPSLNRANGPGMLGQGNEVNRIERIRDAFVEARVNETTQQKSYWETKQKYLSQTEIIYNEPSDESVRSQLDRFWQSWQELSQYPEELSHREVVRESGRELSFRIRNTFDKLFQLRAQVDNDLDVSVNQVNALATELRDLNVRIMKSVALGDDPNDLRDMRDQKIGELSKLTNTTVEYMDPNEAIVYIGGMVLVQGEKLNLLQTQSDPSNEGLKKVVWGEGGKDAVFREGHIQALLEVRDGVLSENIKNLDLLAVNISDIVNEVHRDGFGLTKETNINFFHLDPLARNIRGNFDLNGDGTDDTSAVFKVAGRNEIATNRPMGISGTLTFSRNDEANTPVHITYREDETLGSVIERINRSGAGVVAYVNHNNNLVLKGKVSEDNWRSSFMIRHMEDSGELLSGYAGILQNSGPAGAFDYRRLDEINKLSSDLDRITLVPVLHPAGVLRLSDEVEGNAALIAAASGKDIGGTGDANEAYGLKDGSNALRIAQALRHNNTMVGEHKNTDEFYNALIAKLGIESKTAQDQVDNQGLILDNLQSLRQSVMGVNLDEEMANMVQFQHGYNAAARIMQTMSEMIETLITRLG